MLRAGFAAHQKKGYPLSRMYLHGAALFVCVGDGGSDLGRCPTYSMEAYPRLSHSFDDGYDHSVCMSVAAVYASAPRSFGRLDDASLVPVMQATLGHSGRQHDLLSSECEFFIFIGQWAKDRKTTRSFFSSGKYTTYLIVVNGARS